ncbi:sulfatase [Fulvivirgaceae bacterium BMA12]|uniref:Sulfatase n=1 Tax=Agaribacillus aureus TaxID=3051825 RepID=A0ABT8KZ58_9BACT|nr:sulfatase [Fulvivirgaceae bacterium BMA12]
MKTKDNSLYQGLTLSLLLLLVTSCSPSPSPGNQSKFNVLFIAVDDLNDWTGFLNGHPQAVTPNMDRLARQGMVFERAYCAAPVCNPSRVALMTGYRPSTSGIYGNNDFMREADLLKDALTIPQWFSKHGYHTMARGKIFHHANGKWADTISWNDWQKNEGRSMTIHPALTDSTLVNGMPYNTRHQRALDWGPMQIDVNETSDFKTAKWAAHILQEKHDKPFFLACGIFRPHLPWYVPHKYFDSLAKSNIEVPAINEADLEDLSPFGKQISEGLNVDGDYQRIKGYGLQEAAVQGYLVSIRYADDCVGEVLSALEKSAYKDKTIVVLWGDHGWHLGEKLHYRKFVLWEESTRVPLIIYVPGLTNGERCSQPVNLIDLYPTLLDLCGLPENTNNEGRSIVPLLKNAEATWDFPSITTMGPNRHAVRTKQWRYIQYDDGSEELYDHHKDSLEWINLANKTEYKTTINELSRWLPSVNTLPVSGGLDIKGQFRGEQDREKL